MMEVAFDYSKTDIHKVHIAIANVGHDTKMHKLKMKLMKNFPAAVIMNVQQML